MDSLLPDVPEPLKQWDITVTVPREGGGEDLVPPPVPRGKNVLGVWTAEQGIMSVTVKASTLLEAAVLGLAAVGHYARMPGASLDVRPVTVRPRVPAGADGARR